MAERILHIVGPTATGKTAFVLDELVPHLTQPVTLISADSRQVYSAIPLLSGADVPKGASEQISDSGFPYHVVGTAHLYGIGMLPADAVWSATEFSLFAAEVIADAWRQQRLPVVVGGTGHYHRLLLDHPQVDVPPNEAVRARAESMSVEQLQRWLQEVDADRFKQLNNSDQHNPRRLIRHLEKALTVSEHRDIPPEKAAVLTADHVVVGLTAPMSVLEERIEERVAARLGAGAIDEVQALLESGNLVDSSLGTATGVADIVAYLRQEIDLARLQELWTLHERQYAKRQLTWFNNHRVDHWFDTTQPHFQQQALAAIDAWLE